jgi:hypothetical protein
VIRTRNPKNSVRTFGQRAHKTLPISILGTAASFFIIP